MSAILNTSFASKPLFTSVSIAVHEASHSPLARQHDDEISIVPTGEGLGAVVTGHLARARIRREPARYDGDGFAIAGLLLGWLAVAAWVVGVAAFVLFFGGMVWLAGQSA